MFNMSFIQNANPLLIYAIQLEWRSAANNQMIDCHWYVALKLKSQCCSVQNCFWSDAISHLIEFNLLINH